MMLPQVAFRLLAAACVITGVALAGGAMAASPDGRDAAPAVTAAQVQQASSAADDVPTCARKVKVVYAGYGEGARAACSVTAKVVD